MHNLVLLMCFIAVILSAIVVLMTFIVGILLIEKIRKAYKRGKRYQNAIKPPISDDLLGKIIKFKGKTVPITDVPLLSPLSMQAVAKWRLDFFSAGEHNTDGLDHNILISPNPIALQDAQGNIVMIYEAHFVMLAMPLFKGVVTPEGKANLIAHLQKEDYTITESNASLVQERVIPFDTTVFAVGKLEKEAQHYVITSPDDDVQAPVSALHENHLSYAEAFRLFLISLGCFIASILFTWLLVLAWVELYRE